MLKGKQKIYTFTIQSSKDPNEITESLNDIFYKTKSPIELFYVSRQEGKLVIIIYNESTNICISYES